jgi:hypothetical protein
VIGVASLQYTASHSDWRSRNTEELIVEQIIAVRKVFAEREAAGMPHTASVE